ncbi:MAG: cytochrome-c peroxidase [Cellvibrionaceae bacterium]
MLQVLERNKTAKIKGSPNTLLLTQSGYWRWLGLLLPAITALVFSLTTPLSYSKDVTDSPSDFTLRTFCPPGFQPVLSEKTEGKQTRCKLRSFYQQYKSLQDGGVGGLKTGLPEYRDGFTPQEIDLGRYLFFDPLLSGNKDMSCASCHHPDKGLADGKGRSIGANQKALPRSAPSLWNVAFLKRLFWDGRASSLEEQMLGPLYDVKEMNNNPQQLLSNLNNSENYQKLFSQAFPGSTDITLDNIYRALTAFEASLISLNSRYDQYAHGYDKALNETEIAGLNVFRSFVARCAECHTPPLFSNQQIAVIGTPEPEGMPFDIGAEKPTGDPSLRAGFKVPSLRNIDLTAPYMHSGRFLTLKDTAEFYTKGRGHAVPEGEKLKLHWHIWEPKLSENELDLLVAFMKTLTDETFKPQTPEQLPSGLPLVHLDDQGDLDE